MHVRPVTNSCIFKNALRLGIAMIWYLKSSVSCPPQVVKKCSHCFSSLLLLIVCLLNGLRNNIDVHAAFVRNVDIADHKLPNLYID